MIGFTVVLRSFGNPLTLKLIPNTPSPTFFPIRISPTTGIFEIKLFKVFAGTSVPLKLTRPLFFST